jgi:MFS family permease
LYDQRGEAILPEFYRPALTNQAFTEFAGLAVFRFILGAFEASISPSMLIVVSMWWTRREQPLRNNIWYSANGVATCLGSLIAFGLGHITHGHLFRYQYIFLTTGAIALLLFFPTVYLFPSHPTTARWLSEEQKYVAIERIRLNNTGTQNTHFKWSQVRECLLDPKSWLWVVMIFTISLVSGGIGTFGPLIIQGFGFDPYQTILFNMIPGPIQIAANLITAYVVQKTKYKAPVLLVVTLFPLAAAAALFAMPRGAQYTNKLLGVYYVLQIFAPITSLIFTWT